MTDRKSELGSMSPDSIEPNKEGVEALIELQKKAKEKLVHYDSLSVAEAGFHLPVYVYPEMDEDNKYQIYQELFGDKYQNPCAYAYDGNKDELYLVSSMDEYGYYDQTARPRLLPPDNSAYPEIRALYEKDKKIIEARKELSKKLSGGDHLLEKIISMSVAEDGVVDPITKQDIDFYQVGENESHRFYLGVKDGKLYKYSHSTDEIYLADEISDAKKRIVEEINTCRQLAKMSDQDFERYVSAEQQKFKSYMERTHLGNEELVKKAVSEIEKEIKLAQYLLNNEPKDEIQFKKILELMINFAGHVDEPKIEKEMGSLFIKILRNTPRRINVIKEDVDKKTLNEVRKKIQLCLKKIQLCLKKIIDEQKIPAMANNFVEKRMKSNKDYVEGLENNIRGVAKDLKDQREKGKDLLQMNTTQKNEYIEVETGKYIKDIIDNLRQKLATRVSIFEDEKLDKKLEEALKEFMFDGSAVREISLTDDASIYIGKFTLFNPKDLTVQGPQETLQEIFDLLAAMEERKLIGKDKLN